jgi:hypothetical protein
VPVLTPVILATWEVEIKKIVVDDLPLHIVQEREPHQVPVAHNGNPSYSGDRNQEDHGSKPVCADSSREPSSKNPSQKKKNRAGGVAQGEGTEFKPPLPQKKKERKRPHLKYPEQNRLEVWIKR